MNPAPSTTGRRDAPPVPLLTPLEIHSGMIFGPRLSPAPAPERSTRGGVRETLETILLAALRRPPCKIAFSGGRDSSALLAAATEIARRRGLADPVPLTFRFDDVPRSHETEWQELMIRHLGLRGWEVVPIRAEFDVLGPLARETLLRFGLFWPPNVYTMRRMFDAARGGSLVTGAGGDEVFGSIVQPRIMTTRELFRAYPISRAGMILLVYALPFPWRLRIQNYKTLRLPWLTSGARREVRRRYVRSVLERRDSDRHPLEFFDESRHMELHRETQSAFVRDAGVELIEPFLDSRFFHAIVSETPDEGVPNRNAGLARFFGDLLPSGLLERTSKARFTESFWGPDARAFAREWDGEGLDGALVDREALRSMWLRERPDLRSASAIQAAWLAREGRGPDFQPFPYRNGASTT